MIPAASSLISVELSPIIAPLSRSLRRCHDRQLPMSIVAWLAKHKTLLNIVKHHEILLKHCETSWNTRTLAIRCDDIGARCGDLGARWGDIGAQRGNIGGSVWRYRHSREVSSDIGDCGVGMPPQMCNRVTDHGDMGTFSRPAWCAFIAAVLVLYWVLSVAHSIFLWRLLKHQGYMPCLGVNLYLELKNATTHSQRMWSSQIYVLKSARDQMVSTPIQLEYAVFILVTPWDMFSSI